MKRKVSIKVVFPILLVLVLAVCVFAIPDARAETYTGDFNVENPTMEFKLIDSSPYGVTYPAKGDFEQNGDTYTLRSNTYVAWFESDDIAFAYNQYNIGDSSKDNLDMQMTVVSQTPETAGKVLHENASVGIMMRDSLDANGAEVFLHIRQQKIMMVYRMKKGDTDSRAIETVILPFYPVELRLVREGKLFTGYYREVGPDRWLMVGSCAALFQGPTYGGIATHTCEESTMSKVVCKNVKAKGSGSYSGGSDDSPSSGGSSSGGTSSIEPGPEDAPVEENVLLRETFSDGSLTAGEVSVTNPIWKNPSSENIVFLEDGNRVWHRDYADGYDFIGDQTWTDYTASVDFMFANSTIPQNDNQFNFHFRNIQQDMYGVFDYYVGVESYSVTKDGKIQKDEAGNVIRNTKLVLRKRTTAYYQTDGTALAECAEIGNVIGDNTFHNIKVEALDNHFKIYFDGKLAIDYTDENYLKNLLGCVGISSYNTSVYVDNIIVTKLEDPLGGDYDNYIGGRFDEPAPEYIDDMKIPYYEFTTPPKDGTINREEN